jgi:ATP-dependent DNA helicase PIF1
MTNDLANGTRFIVIQFMQHVIEAEVATGPAKGQRMFIPRLSITLSDTERMPFTLRRRQFPVRLPFAMTNNKAQGQTLKMVDIFLPKPIFTWPVVCGHVAHWVPRGDETAGYRWVGGCS